MSRKWPSAIWEHKEDLSKDNIEMIGILRYGQDMQLIEQEQNSLTACI